MEFLVGVLALLVGWVLCWFQMAPKLQSESRSVVYWCQMVAARELEIHSQSVKIQELQSRLVQETDLQMDSGSTQGWVSGLMKSPQSAFLSGSALVQQEQSVLD